eukprot:m.18959 g.18959  ORF g.18959 m.18959 type:complete len:320 (-) comp12271_c1_seq1:86-1045(-)
MNMFAGAALVCHFWWPADPTPSLPDEVLLMIFLRINEYPAELQHVCPRWRRICQNSEAFQAHLREFPDRRPTRFALAIDNMLFHPPREFNNDDDVGVVNNDDDNDDVQLDPYYLYNLITNDEETHFHEREDCPARDVLQFTAYLCFGIVCGVHTKFNRINGLAILLGQFLRVTCVFNLSDFFPLAREFEHGPLVMRTPVYIACNDVIFACFRDLAVMAWSDPMAIHTISSPYQIAANVAFGYFFGDPCPIDVEWSRHLDATKWLEYDGYVRLALSVVSTYFILGPDIKECTPDSLRWSATAAISIALCLRVTVRFFNFI